MNSRFPTAPAARLADMPRARFSFGLVILLGLLFWVVGPGAVHDSRFLLEVTVGAVLVAAVVAATADRRDRGKVILVGCLAALIQLIWVSGRLPAGLAIGPGVAALFGAYSTLRTLRAVLGSRQVTRDVLAGALAAYVIAGLTFAIIYGAIEAGTPGAFHLPEGTATFPDLVYFSFVTLLTVGYGDVTPTLPSTRAVTLFEGLFGLVYTTVVMARLVAAYLMSLGAQEGPQD